MTLQAQIVGRWGRLAGDPQLRGHFGRIPFEILVPNPGTTTNFDALELSIGIDYINDGTTDRARVTNLGVDVLGTLFAHTVQAVTTTGPPLDLRGVPLGGYVILINRSAVSTVKYFPSSGADALAELRPLEVAVFRTSEDSSTPHLSTVSGTADLDVYLFSA